MQRWSEMRDVIAASIARLEGDALQDPLEQPDARRVRRSIGDFPAIDRAGLREKHSRKSGDHCAAKTARGLLPN
jgi:hypothetical protein